MEKEYYKDGEHIGEKKDINSQVLDSYPTKPYRCLNITLQDNQLTNDGTDTETVTIEVVDGLEVAKGTDPSNATVLDYNGDCTLNIDGAETTKTLNSGSVSFDITTTKSAGETIEVVAQTLTDHPAESDGATIEVVE